MSVASNGLGVGMRLDVQGPDWEVAVWDWVVAVQGRVLHMPRKWHDPDGWMNDLAAETLCGRRGLYSIPGVFSRMSAPRCARCCQRAGIPQGDGSPKNDDALRPWVEKVVAAARAVSEADR